MVRKERCGLSSCVSGSLWNRNGGHAASQVALPGSGPRPAPLWTRPAPTMVSRWAALTRVRLCRLCQPSSQRILLVLRLSLYVLCVNLPHLDGFIPLSVISATNTPHHQLWLQNRFRMWEIHTSEPTSLSSFGLHFSGPASAMTLSSLWLLHSEKMCLFQTKKTFRWFCQGLGIKLNWIKNK